MVRVQKFKRARELDRFTPIHQFSPVQSSLIAIFRGTSLTSKTGPNTRPVFDPIFSSMEKINGEEKNYLKNQIYPYLYLYFLLDNE